MTGRQAHATGRHETRRHERERSIDRDIHLASRRLFGGRLARDVRQLIATAGSRFVCPVCEDQFARRNDHPLFGPVNRVADAIGDVSRPGAIQRYDARAADFESTVMRSHDGIRRDRSLEIASRMCSGFDDRVRVDRPRRLARGHFGLACHRRRRRTRRRSRGNRVSTPLEKDRRDNQANDDKG
jgi:hypothetical protein